MKKNISENQQYKVGLYLRLSKEDGDKEESNSISNQKDYIKSYLKNNPDLKETKIYIDDGYTGTNFERPQFENMMEDVKNQVINCIIVKDLSRFGRNYLQTGYYIEELFPYLGIRFIAINDNYDSLKSNNTDNITVSLKNIINDVYSSDISAKTKSHLAVKRRNGEFTGSHTIYGYKKHISNKNKLVIDEEAEHIVRDIFKWKLQGYSTISIAEKLNNLGILSPLEYKLACGIAINQKFKTKNKAVWDTGAVARILKNELYIGNLVQGKETVKNYKTKERIKRTEEEWDRVASTHEAIILEEDFLRVQELLQVDTRKSPVQEKLYLLSGYVVCNDCGQNMIRKNVPSKGKSYTYYVCSTNKAKKEKCSSHSISEKKLVNAVTTAIKDQINQMMDMEEMIQSVDEFTLSVKSKKLSIGEENKQIEIDKIKKYSQSLYEDYKDGILTKEEYMEIKKSYDSKLKKLLLECEEIKKYTMEENDITKREWIQRFKKYRNVEEVTREMLLDLVEKIKVYKKGIIEIKYRYTDQYEQVCMLLLESEKPEPFIEKVQQHITLPNTEMAGAIYG